MTKKLRKIINNLLLSAGLRKTEARKVVLSVLFRAKKTITQEQIANKLGDLSPDKVTIYRTLESLLAADLVHKAFLHKRTWHFELSCNCTDTQCHPHFTCTSCGQTQCLTKTYLPMMKTAVEGFIIQRQRVQLEGLCAKCARRY